MNQREFEMLNQRIDDMYNALSQDIRDLKISLDKYITTQTKICNEARSKFNKRVTILEHFKTKILTIASGISLILGLIIGKYLS